MAQNQNPISAQNDRRTIAAIGWAKKFLFAVSVITSSFFLYSALELGNYHWALSALGGLAIFALCVFMDFVGVGIILPTGLQKVITAFVEGGRFRPLVQAANFAILFVGLSMLAASAYTSYYGSTIAGAAVAGRFDAAGMLKPMKEQRLEKEAALSPLRSRIDSLEAVRQQAIEEAAGPALMGLYKNKRNRWAKDQIDSISKAVGKKYDSEIQAAKASFAQADSTEGKTYGTVAKVLGQDLELKAEAHKAKATALQTLSRYAGLASIILAFICEIIISLLTVAADTEPQKANKRSEDEALERALQGNKPKPRNPGSGGGGNDPKQGGGGNQAQRSQSQYEAVPFHLHDRP